MQKTFLAWVLTLFSFQVGVSQPLCGFDAGHQKQMAQDSVYRKAFEESTRWIETYIKANPIGQVNRPGAAPYSIPVVVHVVHTGGAVGSSYNPTDLQIQQTIQYLNQVYNGSAPGSQGVGDIEIQFVLATRDPNCNPTNGIVRVDGSGISNYAARGVNRQNSDGVDAQVIKDFSRWDPYRYYNIWLVNRIDGADGLSPGSFIAGFAQLPGPFPLSDGTVMLTSQMLPNRKTLPHEIGHAFGLLHPFEGQPQDGTPDPCNAEANCVTEGDRVCDTDPVKLPVGFVCRTGPNPCTGGNYSINTEHNYMNYTNCATLFTAGQKAVMLASAEGPYRKGLATSWGQSTTYPLNPFTAPLNSSCTPTTGATGLSAAYSGLVNLTLNGRNFTSGHAQRDGGYVPANRCLSLSQLQPGVTYTMDLSPLGGLYEQLRVWIDYDNNGVFDNATEEIFYGNNINPTGAYLMTVSGSFTVPMTTTVNTPLRMRVISELGTIYGGALNIVNACYNPTYGQAEDFPVVISAAALPVTLIRFSGQRKMEAVLLEWQTGSESESSHFEIERSADGREFEYIGRVEARGKPSVYAFRDEKAAAGKNIYRLKNVDQDGSHRFSQVIVIAGSASDQGRIRVQTNLVRDNITLQVIGDQRPQQATLHLRDISGRSLVQKKLIVSGTQTIQLDISSLSLPAGLYLLEVNLGSERLIEKIVKQ
jgi:hypothetical protein